MNIFSYYISGQESVVTPESDIWNRFIPADRDNSKSRSLTYGTFFKACENFLGENIHSFPVPRDREISHIAIKLEKHGKFYHPARIILSTDNDEKHTFVLNTAVDETGIMCMDFEVKSLQMLNELKYNHIPHVYFSDEFDFENICFSMFSGNWFDNYSEFHITREGDNEKIIVWDYNGNYYLNRSEETEIYRQCSRIMTDYYDENSFSQISPWHHAAGDFVIKKEDETFDVKLITVRQYSPFAEVDDPSEEDLLQGLLFFFINLSIRMRLDRIDGIHELVWAGDHSLDGFFKGFMESLENKKPVLSKNKSLKECFISFAKGTDFELLYEMAEDITNSYNQKSPEIPLIKTNLENHIKKICTFLI